MTQFVDFRNKGSESSVQPSSNLFFFFLIYFRYLLQFLDQTQRLSHTEKREERQLYHWTEQLLIVNQKKKKRSSREGTEDPPVVSQFRLRQRKGDLFLVSLFNLFTSVKLEQLFFFSLILSHNGTKWPLLATLQQAAKRPRRREMEEKV